jgi:hypothetical protein
MLYDSEVLCTLPQSASQKPHADVSLGDIGDPDLQTNVMRLVVIMILTLDGDATTVVYPNTRSEKTFAEPIRTTWTAPKGHNCVLFDGRMAHNGVAFEGHEELHRLVFVFHHPDATKEQLKVIEICLGRKSLNINVESMLASRTAKEAEMLARRAETEAKMLAHRAAAAAEKHAHRAATAAETLRGGGIPRGGRGGGSTAASAMEIPQRAASGEREGGGGGRCRSAGPPH